MNNQTEENFSFCPKCGSLMENGVCPECSRKGQQGVYSSRNWPGEAILQSQDEDGTGQENRGQSEQNWNDLNQGQWNPNQSCQNQGQPYQNWGQQDPNQPYQNWNGQSPNQPCQNQGQQDPNQPYQNWSGQNPNQPYQNWGQQDPSQSYQNWGQQDPNQSWQNWNGQSQGQSYQNWQGGQQNQYYGQQPYQGQNYNNYNPYMKDNKVWIIVGVTIGIIFLFLFVFGGFFYGYTMTRLMSTTDYMGGEYGDYRDYGRDSDNSDDRYTDDDGDVSPGEDEDYVPSPEDEYYYGPCNAIDESVGYSFVTKSYTNEDPDNDIDIIVNYVELKGDDIPNIDNLNEALESVALYYAVDFPQYYGEYGNSYAVYNTAYVTYNDEDIVSIVMDEYVVMDDEYHVDLYAINIDVKNGVILDNDSLLKIDAEFAEEFRERNNEQNGNIDYLDSITDEELTLTLQDNTSMIAYYTPLGMEVGFNYADYGSSGWLTVTYKDYAKYQDKF